MPIKGLGMSISEFIAVCRLIWTSFLAHVADFTAVSPNLTAVYGNAQLAAIDAAEAMPDKEQRESDAQMLRTELVEILKKIIAQFIRLIIYIEQAYPSNQATIQIAAAGGGNLEQARKEKWDKVDALTQSEITFLAAFAAFLIANGGMPANFEADFLLLVADYIAKRDAYKAARIQIPIDTAAKNNALATIDTNTKFICRIAKRINFSTAVSKEFNFSHVYATVSSPKPSGFQGRVTLYPSLKPVTNAVITLISTGVNIHVDSNGYFRIEHPEGQCPISINAPEPATGGPYLPRIEMPYISKGTVSTFNIQLMQQI